MSSVQKGKQGEKIAENYLLSKGYKIIKKNYRTIWAEIDIITWDSQEQELVFVEVKTRSSRRFGYPEEAVDSRKIDKISIAADDYLKKTGFKAAYRFDCLAIEMSGEAAEVVQYRNIG